MGHTSEHPLFGYPAEPLPHPRINNPILANALASAKTLKAPFFQKKCFRFGSRASRLHFAGDCSSGENLI